MSLTVSQDFDGNPIIDSWDLGFSLRCPSGEELDTGLGFYGFGVPVEKGEFVFNFQSLYFFFEFSGTFVVSDTGETGVVGDARMEQGGLRYKRGLTIPQKCTSGKEVAWRADLWSTIPEPPGKDVSYRIERHPDGNIAVRSGAR